MTAWLKSVDNWIYQHRALSLLLTIMLTLTAVSLANWISGSDLFRQFFFPKICDRQLPATCDPLEWKDLFQAAIIVLGLPVAFLIWHWRDTNVRDQIENARKDINLKEFQELQLRAAGAISTDIPEQSRQTLWISALHQMRGYLRGEYGESFRRPALEVYCALMARRNRSEKTDAPEEVNPEPDSALPDSVYRTVRDVLFEEWKSFFWQDFVKRVGWPLQGRSLRRIRLPVGTILDGLDLSRTDFSGSDFSSVSFRRARLWDANFQSCNLRSAVLIEVEGEGVNLDQVDMAGVSAKHADFSGSSFKEAKFHGANLEGASFFKAHGGGCSFVNVNLCRANFNDSRLYGADFQNSRVAGATFVSSQISDGRIDGADFTECDFSFADLGGFYPMRAKSIHHARLNGKTKVPHWNKNSYEKLNSLERAEILSVWLEHGALLVPPSDDPKDFDNDQDALAIALKRVMETGNGTQQI